MKAVTVAGGSSENPKVEVPEEGPQPPEESSTPSTADVPDGDAAAATDADAGATGGDVPEDADGTPGPAREEDPAEGSGDDDRAEAEGAAHAAAEGEPDRPADEDGAEAGAGGESGETGTEARPDTEAGASPGPAAAATDGPDTETADSEHTSGTSTETADDAPTAPDTTPSAAADGKAGASTEAEPGTDAETDSEHDAAPATDAAADADADASSEAETDAASKTASNAAAADARSETEAEAASEPASDDDAAATDAPAEGGPATEDAPDRTGSPAEDAEAAGTGGTKPTPADPAPPRRPSWAQGAEPGAAPKPDAVSGVGSESKSESESKAASAPHPKSKPTSTSTSTSEPESEAVRTSQFVALKPVDIPRPAPQPTTALPLVPPPAPAPGPAPSPWPVVTGPKGEVPLDLLAELTNTAPPPETPRRTALRRVKIWTPILLVLAGAVAGAQLLRPLPDPKIVGTESLHTIDGQFTIPWPAKGQGAVRVSGSGDIGTFGEQKPVPTASVAKVMTAYVILKSRPLRKGEPGPDIVVDAKAVADGTSESESRITGLVAGTKFNQQDMLKMLMIPSGNNVARLLARWDTGTDSEAAFVEKMNAAAKELGMNDTTYTDPSGLDASTVSTATDQLRLAEAVMEDEAFRSVVALPDAQIKGLPGPIYNNNDLLTAPGLSIRGIKTGSSTPAGGTLMWAAYKSVGDETPLILGTLMDQRVESGPDPDASNSLILVKANSKKIIEAVRSALASAPVIRKGQEVGYVDDGLGGRTPLVATKDVNVVGVPGQPLRISLGSTAGAGPVPHSAKAGAEIGVLTVGEGAGAKSVPVAVRGALAEPSFGTRLTRLG
ncbi:D-alanyl-D-alanine carboxypeptidase family protein [Streptomyces sp. H27-S2]|uniref:D-alanyl-D-alanine carboxypeptidase family protein n=1 Tax=Streptomyces antarcticus TaxID=2996458 RepID=UPI00227116EC|nr:serine hydrolase [Streptomyces sp. H27-S2]MCY0949648.1 D-alanyl-D-alanine carboxypeptidase [Streptomyces sp. H27-S2]